jgi:YHS domain-containing protein
MNSVLEILWIILIYIFIQRIVLVAIGVMKKAASATRRKKPQVDIIEEDVGKAIFEEPIEMVVCFNCDEDIQRKKAYQMVSDEGSTYFFCSWLCRQKFVEKQLNKANNEEEI